MISFNPYKVTIMLRVQVKIDGASKWAFKGGEAKELQYKPHGLYKNWLKMDHRVKYKTQNYKAVRKKNTGKNLKFLELTLKAWSIRGKIDKPHWS